MTSGSGWHRTVAALVVTVAVPMTAAARQTEGLFDRTFETAMQHAAPDFRPQPLAPRRDGSSFYKAWTFNGARVSVRYFVCESPDSAAELLQERISVLSIPTKRIDDFSDEAYLLAPYNPNGERKIWLRKGAVVLEVGAYGEAGTRRFARLFGDEVVRFLAGQGTGAR